MTEMEQITHAKLRAVREELEVARAEIRRLNEKAASRMILLAESNKVASQVLDKSQEYLDELTRLRALCTAHGIDHRKQNHTVHTEFINPALPFRHCDWIAWVEPGYCTGHGKSEKEALENLRRYAYPAFYSVLDSALAGKVVSRG